MQQSYAVSRLLLSDPVSLSISNQTSSLLFTMFIPTHKVETRHVWICVAVSDALSQRPTPSVHLSQAIVFALCVCSRSPLNQTFPSNKGNSCGLILMTPSTKGKLSQQVLGIRPRLPNSNSNLLPCQRARNSSSGSPSLGYLLHVDSVGICVDSIQLSREPQRLERGNYADYAFTPNIGSLFIEHRDKEMNK